MKKKLTKNFSKNGKKRRTSAISLVDPTYIIWFFGCVLALSFLTLFFASISYGQELADFSTTSSELPKLDKTEKMMDDLKSNTALSRIIDMNGVVGIDGSLRVLETNYVKIFDLVEISTPVTPAVNHARLFLRPDGTKQSLVIIFDDSTAVRIAGN